MPDAASAAAAATGARGCAGCGTQLAPSLLVCPLCGGLAHAETVARLERDADAAAAAADIGRALELRREALELLPAGSPHHTAAASAIAELTRGAPAADAPPHSDGWRRWWGVGAAAGLFLLTKGKLLLLGLTKATTLFSMLAFVGVYWNRWGWAFGFGIALSIYVHEMGHVAALARYGIKASAPMFIPGLGALVRLHQLPANRHEDARIGLAGPVWGLGAALAAYGVYLGTGIGTWRAIAHTGAWINLFNLLPIWQLDGGRGFRALSRDERWMAVAALGAAWLLTREGLLVGLGAVAVIQAFRDAPDEGDNGALALYGGLVAALTALVVAARGGGAPTL